MQNHIRKGAAAAAAAGAVAVAGIVAAQAAQSPVSIRTVAAAAPSPATQPREGGRPAPNPADRQEDDKLVAAAIGISVDQLNTERKAGKSLADIARAHGASVDKVIAALVADETKEIDARVAAGQETKAQADQQKAGLKQRITDQVNRAGRGPGGRGGHRGGGMQDEDRELVAGAIGITAAQLQTELQSGKTIAQVAQAHGAAVDALISKWVASENKEVDDRLAAGRLTQAQADQMKANMQQRITALVNGTHPAGPGGRPAGSPPAGAPPAS